MRWLLSLAFTSIRKGASIYKVCKEGGTPKRRLGTGVDFYLKCWCQKVEGFVPTSLRDGPQEGLFCFPFEHFLPTQAACRLLACGWKWYSSGFGLVVQWLVGPFGESIVSNATLLGPVGRSAVKKRPSSFFASFRFKVASLRFFVFPYREPLKYPSQVL